MLACFSPSQYEIITVLQSHCYRKVCSPANCVLAGFGSPFLRFRRSPHAVLHALCMLRSAARLVRCVYVGVAYGGLCTRMHAVGCRCPFCPLPLPSLLFLSFPLSLLCWASATQSHSNNSLNLRFGLQNRVPWSFRWGSELVAVS